MISIKVYRNEWKYILTNQQINMLKERLSKIMNVDKNTPKEGKYLIHSLYFDDYKDIALYTCDAGLSKRYKWRIRYYGSDLNYIVLERKEKLEGRGHKKLCQLTLDEYEKIVSGDIFDLIYDTDKVLIKELIKDIMCYGYKPKIIIDYERIAYVEEISNVRITFDMKISASYELDRFLYGDYQNNYILPNGINLLEVKFDYILPSYIKKMVESYNFKQTAFSKYYMGRKLINNNHLR